MNLEAISKIGFGAWNVNFIPAKETWKGYFSPDSIILTHPDSKYEIVIKDIKGEIVITSNDGEDLDDVLEYTPDDKMSDQEIVDMIMEKISGFL